MRLLFIRHGDPDYEHDCLTEKGIREAQYLAERMMKEAMDEIYVSPLGRAQETASYTLKATGRTAETKEWLKEFDPQIHRPDCKEHLSGCWDWHPEDWMQYDEFFDCNRWGDNPILAEGKVKERYGWVCDHFDELLASKGYRRHNHYYKVNRESHETLVFFCHFGVECVILSHLTGLPFMPFIHGFVCNPTGVTELFTEERDKGIANFRITMYGDLSHLYVHDEKPSFTGRCCECYSDPTRH